VDSAERRSRGLLAAKALIPILVTVVILLLPEPSGIKPHGWAVLAVFMGTVVGLILQPLPAAAVAIVGLTVLMITKQLEVATALSGFSDSTIWLIVSAFFLSKAGGPGVSPGQAQHRDGPR
jgi:DASS family divalent anion:Na+ symporter